MKHAYLKALACAVLSGFLIGWFATNRQKPLNTAQVETRTTQDVVQTQDTVKTRTEKKPDGTVVVEKTKTKTKTTASAQEETTTKLTENALKGYSIAIHFEPRLDEIVIDSFYLGRHLAGPIWAEIGVHTNQSLSLGVRGEF